MKRESILTAAFTIAVSVMAQGTLTDYQRAYSIGGRYAGKTSNSVLQSQFVINDEVGKFRIGNRTKIPRAPFLAAMGYDERGGK